MQVLGRLVQSAGLSDGVLHGDPRALLRLDDVVQAQVLSESIVRVKVWSRDGRVLYSDAPEIIGRRFVLGELSQATGGPLNSLVPANLVQPSTWVVEKRPIYRPSR